MLFIKRLSTIQVQKGVPPWDWRPVTPFPEELRTDKKLRDAWANHPDTDSNFYTGLEAMNPNVRISQESSEREGNPPVREHFLVADYDCPTPVEQVLHAAKHFQYPPNRLERTLSGNWRAVWFLSSPIVLAGYDFAKFFKKKFPDVAFNPAMLLPGFDKGAWEAAERFWTNSGEWTVIHDKPLPEDLVLGWTVTISNKFGWSKAFSSTKIPLEVVRGELVKKYPAFAAWPGEFELNAQGPTFWVPESKSPKSAIVRETGIQTFSDHAAKGFYQWVDLLGKAFCSEFEAEALGRAVNGVHYDGKSYWRPIARGKWKPFEKGDLALHLKVARGVSSVPDKSGVSDIDRAIEFIQSNQQVDGAAPFVYRPPGIVEFNQNTMLNTCFTKVLQPAETTAVWGKDGQFPWLSNFFDTFFRTPEQLPFFLSWAAHFYRSGLDQEPRSGHNIFIAGNVGRGKTMLVRGLLGRVFGGYAEASQYLTGNDGFGAELFERPLWVIDDGSFSSSATEHRKFTEIIKRMAANETHRYHEKYRVAAMVQWQGRAVVTLNVDGTSLDGLPDLDRSIREKIMLFRLSEGQEIVFPTRAQMDLMLERETPYFAAFLRDYVIPPQCVGKTRFGVKEYLDPSLVETAHQTSSIAGFGEILVDWAEQYFNMTEPKATQWEGTSFQLQKAILLDPTAGAAMRDYSVRTIGRQLAGMETASRPGISSRGLHGSRVWKIKKDFLDSQREPSKVTST